jgi:outer membrane protein OmpA-like peptidoglycan-associated protein
MKTKINIKTGLRAAWFPFNRTIKSLSFIALVTAGIQVPVQAQVAAPSKPSWWFGVAGGANLNFYRGSTQQINNDLTVPAAFHKGHGIGHYLAPVLIEYRPFGSLFGFSLQAGSDSRKGSFKEVLTPCNCPTELQTKMRYYSIEPNLIFSPFKNNFYLFGGPRMSFRTTSEFTYQVMPNPEFPAQVASTPVKGDFSYMENTLFSMQVGAGYDIPLSADSRSTQFVLSPFVSFQPYFGQSPRYIETWSITTVRVGAALKVGHGRRDKAPKEEVLLPPPVVAPVAIFAVQSPRNITVGRKVNEIFPLRNYVYFNLGSTAIPDRYVLLEKSQVKDFKEDQLEQFAPKNLSGRSGRQMVVYYNVINILGDRMGKNPNAKVTLVGSSESGAEDGKAMAESVKTYLVNVFSIDPSRIAVQGRVKPVVASDQSGGATDLPLHSEDDRRVSIESSSPEMLMEFQSGPGAPLKPVSIKAIQEAPLDSYVSFSAAGEKEPLTNWSLEIKDEKGAVKNFGPYKKQQVSIPGKSIMGTTPEGNYHVTMTGKTKNGETVKRDTTVHMVLWTPPTTQEGTRFSVIFEFDESNTAAIYEKYLSEVVTPKIPVGGTVYIHGYTDITGEDAHNQALSLARAKDVKNIIAAALAKAGRSDVKFEVLGFGEDENTSPFENRFPEERSYNRAVVIDIIPAS